jgi:hypothetical protein
MPDPFHLSVEHKNPLDGDLPDSSVKRQIVGLVEPEEAFATLRLRLQNALRLVGGLGGMVPNQCVDF